MLTSTYQGCRTLQGRDEAVIRVTGELERHSTKQEFKDRSKDRVTGVGIFDVAGGFFRKLTIFICAEAEVEGALLGRCMEFDLERTPGNSLGLTMPSSNPDPDPSPIQNATVKIVLQQIGTISSNNPTNPEFEQ